MQYFNAPSFSTLMPLHKMLYCQTNKQNNIPQKVVFLHTDDHRSQITIKSECPSTMIQTPTESVLYCPSMQIITAARWPRPDDEQCRNSCCNNCRSFCDTEENNVDKHLPLRILLKIQIIENPDTIVNIKTCMK
jgi:hypothetical protein